MLLIMLILLGTPAFTFAQTIDDITPGAGVNITGQRAGFIDSLNDKIDLLDFAGTAINGLFGAVAAIFVAVIMIGGVKWMQALGNEEMIGKAKKLILNGIYGMMVIVLAYALVISFLFALNTAALTGPSSS